MPTQESLQHRLASITNRIRINTAALLRVNGGRAVNNQERNQFQIISAQLNQELADCNRLLALERPGIPRQGAAFQFGQRFHFGGIPALQGARDFAYNPNGNLMRADLYVPNQAHRAPVAFGDPVAARQRREQHARDQVIITQRRKEAREKAKLAKQNLPILFEIVSEQEAEITYIHMV